MNRINYTDLNDRQKENFNFTKVAALLADYGFSCIRLSDDWQGADFLACHIDGNTTIKVQLKGRLTLEKKYVGKDIHIAFPYKGEWYLFPHDDVIEFFKANGRPQGFFSAGYLSVKQLHFMQQYKIGD